MSNYTDMVQALKVCIDARVPVVLIGAPGQGKSQVIRSHAEQSGRPCVTLYASQCAPDDIKGLPTIVEKKVKGKDGSTFAQSQTKFIPQDWAIGLEEDGDGILVFEEMTTAPPATQAALLGVILDKKVGDLFLGEGTSIVAAMNPPDQAADGWDLPLPTWNRLCAIPWNLSAEVVSDGIAFGFPDPPALTVKPDDVERETQAARLLVSAFLRARPSSVTQIPTTTSEDGSGAYPTPRSWETAAKLYGYATAANVSKGARRMLVMGCVGQAAAGEFLTYIAELDLPDSEEVLKNPDKWEIPTRGDRVYAVAAGVLSVLQEKMTEDRWVQAGRVIASISKANHGDVAVAVGRKWMAMRPNKTVMPDPASLQELAPVLKAANLL